MADPYRFFGGIDFSGAREPLTNLWTAVGTEHKGKLRILSVRPHAFRADLASYVLSGWNPDGSTDRILWGADFPFSLPDAVRISLGLPDDWLRIASWVADRPADEIRGHAGELARSLRMTDTGGALAPLDLRLYKQTTEGVRWLHRLIESGEVSIRPMVEEPDAPVGLIEVYPSATATELGMPRRRAPARAGETRARAAAIRTFMDFASRDCEALVVTLEDAWDAAIACLTAYLCRSDLDQHIRLGRADADLIRREGWIYRPPVTLS